MNIFDRIKAALGFHVHDWGPYNGVERVERYFIEDSGCFSRAYPKMVQRRTCQTCGWVQERWASVSPSGEV